MTRGLMTIALAVLLAGCESPAPPPPPPPQLIVLCTVDEGMTGTRPAPLKPDGNYTQKDVGVYLRELYAWGKAGWTTVEAIGERSRDCDRRAGSRESE